MVRVWPLSVGGALQVVGQQRREADGAGRRVFDHARQRVVDPVGASLTSHTVKLTVAVLVFGSGAPLVVPLSWSV